MLGMDLARMVSHDEPRLAVLGSKDVKLILIKSTFKLEHSQKVWVHHDSRFEQPQWLVNSRRT